MAKNCSLDLMQEFIDNITDEKHLEKVYQEAIERKWQLGIAVYQMDEKGLYELKPNGEKVYSKEEPKYKRKKFVWEV